MRRVIDIASSAVGLLLLSPLLVVIAFVVLADSGFPILYRQVRVGRGKRPFCLLKFRSMRESRGSAPVTAAGDSRVTHAGRVLRRYKLDELPQLWNVLKGDMSLIGPRPEIPCYVDLEDPLWSAILRVRPGITDLATLLYRDEELMLAQAPDLDVFYRSTVLPAKLELSRRYLESHSLLVDLRLIWMTVKFSIRPSQFDALRVRRAFLEE